VAAGLASLIGNGSVEAISASTGAVVHPTVSVGVAPAWISISPDGAQVYTLNFLSDSVSIIDTASWAVTGTVMLPTGSQPIIGAVTPGGTLVVTEFGTHTVDFIDPAMKAVVHSFPVNGRPVGVEFGPGAAKGYVTDFGADSLTLTPDALAFAMGNLSSAIGKGPSEVVEFDPASGTATGNVFPVDAAGAVSVVAE
jgi:YVTN family beta-propeller protein